MLDKSLTYHHVIMHRKPGTPLPCFELPSGYKFVFYKAGDEKYRAVLEASVGEFPSEVDALLYFQKRYGGYLEELKRRCIFIENAAGEKVGTATAWWTYTGTRRDPWVHWVSVSPDYQGKGLGLALSSKIIELMLEIEGDRDFYIHTQTWSHKAIRIYEKVGFYITPEQGLGGYENSEYDKAVSLLNSL